jgi:pyruvate-ferredoxin/flavodoxin oxidoreductase
VDLVALAHQRAFVLSTALSHGAHLAKGLEAALAHPGTALVHVHAPSPRRHGFASDKTLERARAAVDARAHLLLRYDPRAPGAFGTRAVVAENPNATQPWGSEDFVTWAAGEGRFAPHFAPLLEGAAAVPAGEYLRLPPAERAGKAAVVERDGKKWMASETLLRAADERLAAWSALQELTGLVNPFVERTKEQLKKELQAGHEAALAALKAEYEAKLAAVKATSDQEIVGRVTDRLMTIAGYSRPGERS